METNGTTSACKGNEAFHYHGNSLKGGYELVWWLVSQLLQMLNARKTTVLHSLNFLCILEKTDSFHWDLCLKYLFLYLSQWQTGNLCIAIISVHSYRLDPVNTVQPVTWMMTVCHPQFSYFDSVCCNIWIKYKEIYKRGINIVNNMLIK